MNFAETCFIQKEIYKLKSKNLSKSKMEKFLPPVGKENSYFKLFYYFALIFYRYKTTLVMTSELESGETKTTKDQEPEVIVLFNPWSEGRCFFNSFFSKTLLFSLVHNL